MKRLPKALMNEFDARAIVRGGLLFFLPSDAMDFVAAAERNGLRILGVDGFYLTEQGTQPSLENSIDFTAGKMPTANIWLSARQFVEERQDRGLHFGFTIDVDDF